MPDQVALGVVVALVPDRDDRAVLHRVAAGGLDDLRVLDHGLEVPDAAFHLPLLVLGGVVVAVLGQVAQLAGGLDLAGDVRAAVRGQLLELRDQPVVGRLGEVLRGWHEPHRSGRRSAVDRRATLQIDGSTSWRGPSCGDCCGQVFRGL